MSKHQQQRQQRQQRQQQQQQNVPSVTATRQMSAGSHASPQRQQQFFRDTSGPEGRNLMSSGMDSVPSSMALSWPPQAQQIYATQNMEHNNFNQLDFLVNQGPFYGQGQSDADIDAILSNYRPKMSQQPTFVGGSMQSAKPANDAGNQVDAMSTNSIGMNSFDPATAAAAAAAYGHLGYGGVGGIGGQTSQSNDEANWAGVPLSTSTQNTADSPNNKRNAGSILMGNESLQGPAGFGGVLGPMGGYDGDASNSNTSSAQTPGGASSGDDSASGKRRRMTISGTNDNLIEDLQQQQVQYPFDQGTAMDGSKGFAWLNQNMSSGQSGSDSNAAVQSRGMARPAITHHGSSTVDSASLEAMAQETLRRASEDNHRGHTSNASQPREGFDASNSSRSGGAPYGTNQQGFDQLSKPPNKHRRSHSGSYVVGSDKSNVSSSASNTQDYAKPGLARLKGFSGPAASALAMSLSAGRGPTNATHSASSGHAASHPPGLGSQVLRGHDGQVGGATSATDFTKRKGWPNRIVEELLDFAHVLDSRGRFLFASLSVFTLTGWRAEELKGKDILEFIHPEDVHFVSREFHRSMQQRSELSMYYRFRRKPKTASDKRRIQDQREAQSTNVRSRSDSTSGNDSSSTQSVGIDRKQETIVHWAETQKSPGHEKEEQDDAQTGVFKDDWKEQYVIFEVTGRPYFPPDGVGPASAADVPFEVVVDPDTSGSAYNKSGGAKVSNKAKSPTKGGPTGERSDNASRGSNSDVQCFFCSCRLYPSKNVGMLDSFLELKLENERLRILLSELSVSEAGPSQNQQQHTSTGVGVGFTERASEGRRSIDEGPASYYPDYYDFDMEGNSRSSQHLPHVQTSGRPGTGRNESIAGMQTGSRPTSPQVGLSLERTLTQNTAGEEESDEVTSPSGPGEESKKKKKKPKPEDGDYVCTDCGRVDSPEWRKGPLGPKTLCNACGLRWAKKVKRSGGDPNAIAMAAKPTKGQIKAQAAAARAQQQNQQFQAENADLTASGPPSFGFSGPDNTVSPTSPTSFGPGPFDPNSQQWSQSSMGTSHHIQSEHPPHSSQQLSYMGQSQFEGNAQTPTRYDDFTHLS